jgi:hypothetical protein
MIIRFVTHDDVPDFLGLGDFAITPVKPIPSKRYCTPIKDGEYWAMGLPVIIPHDISDDSDIIEENHIGAILKNFTYDDYYEAVKKIDALLQQKDQKILSDKITAIAKKYRNFTIAEKVYSKIYG